MSATILYGKLRVISEIPVTIVQDPVLDVDAPEKVVLYLQRCQMPPPGSTGGMVARALHITPAAWQLGLYFQLRDGRVVFLPGGSGKMDGK